MKRVLSVIVSVIVPAVAVALLTGCSAKPADDAVISAAHRQPANVATPVEAARPAAAQPSSPAGQTWLGAAPPADANPDRSLPKSDLLAAADGDSTASPAPAGRSPDLTTRPAASTAPADGSTYTAWPSRRGPAYPGDFWRSFGRDAKEFIPIMWDDTKAVFTNPVSLIGIGMAGAAGIAINGSGADDNIADQTRRHGHKLSKGMDMAGDVGGNPGTHFALAGALYLASLSRGDTKEYEVSKTLLEALAINGIFTLALKGATRTESPNGDEMGWPSGHTSSSFALATVMAESYGPVAGVPAFAFASFVGYERIDARNHDLSDVVSGALLGAAIGHAVTQNHNNRIFGWEVVPIGDEDKVGVGLAKRW